MKQTIMITAALLLTWMCCACSGEETYAKQKQKEKETIDAFLEREFVVRSSDGTELIRMSKVQVISEEGLGSHWFAWTWLHVRSVSG